MTRYMLFAGESYYPRSGTGDFMGFYDTPEDARRVGAPYDWYEVIETDATIFSTIDKGWN